jgi:hypothetical protein
LLRRVVWYKFDDVSEVLAASIVRASGATTQKTAIFILAAVRTLNLIENIRYVIGMYYGSEWLHGIFSY